MAAFSQKLDKILNDSLEIGLKKPITIQNIDGTTIKFMGTSGSLAKIQIANIADVNLQSITPTSETSNGVSLDSMVKFLKWHNVFVDNVNSETSFSGQLAEMTTTGGIVKITPSTKSFALSTHNHDGSYMKNWTFAATSTAPVNNASRTVSSGSTVSLHKIAASGIPVFTATSTVVSGANLHTLTEISNYTLNKNDIIGIKFPNGSSGGSNISLGGISGQMKTAGGDTFGPGTYVTAGSTAFFVYDGTNFIMLGSGSTKHPASYSAFGPILHFPTGDTRVIENRLIMYTGLDTFIVLTPAESFTTATTSTEYYSTEEIQRIYCVLNAATSNEFIRAGNTQFVGDDFNSKYRLTISAGISTGLCVTKVVTKSGSDWSMQNVTANMPIYLMLNYNSSGIRIVTNTEGNALFTNDPNAVKDSNFNAFLYIGRVINKADRIQIDPNHTLKIFKSTDNGYLEVGHTDHSQLAENAFSLGGRDASLYALKTELPHTHSIGLSGAVTATSASVSQNGTITLSTAYAGTVPVNKGGTGLTTIAANGLLYGNGTGAMSILAAPTSTSRMILTSKGTGNNSAAPLWMTVSELMDEINAVIYKGTLAGGAASPGTFTPAANNGYLYVVSTSGYINGVKFEAGDMLVCNADNTTAATSSNYSTIAAKWDGIQKNLDGVVTGPASSVANRIATFSDTSGKVIKDSGKLVTDLVTGPSSAVADRIAVFNGTTGKIIKDSGKTINDILANVTVNIPVAINGISAGTSNGQVSFTKTDGTSGSISTQKANMVTGISFDSSTVALTSSLIQINGITASQSIGLGDGIRNVINSFLSGSPGTDINIDIGSQHSGGTALSISEANGRSISATINSSSNLVRQPAIANMVNGPASATSGNLAQFSASNGKAISDAGKKVSDLVTAASNGYSTHVPVYDGDGKALKQTDVTITSSNTLEGATNIRQRNNTARVNLGNPTLAEMALIDESFSNKMLFFPLENMTFEKSDDGTNFTVYQPDEMARKRFVGGDSNSYIRIPKDTYMRITFQQYEYVFLNMIYLYCSTDGGRGKMKIEKGTVTDGNTTWTENTPYTNSFSTWPGHVTLWHEEIKFGPTVSSGHFQKVRITIKAEKNGSANDTSYPDMILHRIQWFGGYPAQKRNLYTTDEDKNVTYPAYLRADNLRATTTTDAPLTVLSTIKVENLNADLLDDHDGAYYLDYNNLTNKKTLSVTAGSAVSNQYISGISVSDHAITVSRGTLPTIPTLGITNLASSGTMTSTDTVVTHGSVSGHSIILSRKLLPLTAFSDNKVSQTLQSTTDSTLYNILGSYYATNTAATTSVRVFRNVKVNGKGDLYVGGDLVIGGTTYTENKVSLTTSDSMIELMKRSASTAITGYAGMFVSKYDGVNDGGIFFDANGIAYVGDATVSDGSVTDAANLQPIATRTGFNSNTDGDVPVWSNSSNSFTPSGIFKILKGTASNPINLVSLCAANTEYYKEFWIQGTIKLFNAKANAPILTADKPIKIRIYNYLVEFNNTFINKTGALWEFVSVSNFMNYPSNVSNVRITYTLPSSEQADGSTVTLASMYPNIGDGEIPYIQDGMEHLHLEDSFLISKPWGTPDFAPTGILNGGPGDKIYTASGTKFLYNGNGKTGILSNFVGYGTTILGSCATASSTYTKSIKLDGFSKTDSMTANNGYTEFTTEDLSNIHWYLLIGATLKIRMHNASRTGTATNLTATLTCSSISKTFNIKTLNKDALTQATGAHYIWKEGDTVSFKVTANDLVVIAVEKSAKSPAVMPDGWEMSKDSSNALIFTFTA